jgi:hypothetical protein
VRSTPSVRGSSLGVTGLSSTRGESVWSRLGDLAGN